MELFRKENIETLMKHIIADTYNDVVQHHEEKPYLPEAEAFIRRNLIPGKNVLEVGCGSGASFNQIKQITHAIEPCLERFDRAYSLGRKVGVEVYAGVIEAIPFSDTNFGSVLAWNGGMFQCRSDYEALMEINRVLAPKGTFIFNLYDDSEDIVLGRTYGINNYIRLVKEFGFDIVEKRVCKEEFKRFGNSSIREYYYLAFEKVENFNPDNLRKLQLIYMGEGMYIAKNFQPEGRDWRLK